MMLSLHVTTKWTIDAAVHAATMYQLHNFNGASVSLHVIWLPGCRGPQIENAFMRQKMRNSQAEIIKSYLVNHLLFV